MSIVTLSPIIESISGAVGSIIFNQSCGSMNMKSKGKNHSSGTVGTTGDYPHIDPGSRYWENLNYTRWGRMRQKWNELPTPLRYAWHQFAIAEDNGEKLRQDSIINKK
jgi:hypothetical protein